MSAADHARVKGIFGEAMELSGEARDEFVRAQCAGDPGLLARVRALLDAAEREGPFLTGATVDGPPEEAGMRGVREEEPGTRIGPYKLLQVIGEGGFGRVFMAEQAEPVRRRVALKIIKLGMDTRSVVARFEQERQALAMMDHPNIAKVLDAGATATGRPYFVMELVKGEPITGYCDGKSLSIPERLSLFTQVCQAVQHAHSKGVIHRDIKPSNVLVSTHDGRPVARVIDFGIAKATDQRLTEKTLFTELRQLVGTPEYMSPEQAEGSLDIDTRTDVYSLGVLLYELLTASTPFDAVRLRSAAYGELQRIIREDEPPRPSTRLSQSGGAIQGVAARRRTEPARLGTLVRGELDWIVMRSLEKDRARRYASASEFSADVRRYLDGLPVLAAPPSRVYRARKFVRRNRVAATAGALVLVAVLAGGALAFAGYVSATGAWRAESEQRQQAVRAQEAAEGSERVAREQAKRAKAEAAKTLAVNQFFQRLLEGVDPAKAGRDRDVTVRQLLDRSAVAMDQGGLSDDPGTAATILGTVGGLYRRLGDGDRAQRYIQRAIDLRAEAGLTGTELATLRDTLGQVLRDRDDLVGAERCFRLALADLATDEGGAESAEAASAWNSLAGIALARGEFDEAAARFQKAEEILLRVAPRNEKELLQVRLNQAVLAGRRGDLPGAERLHRVVIEQGRAQLGAEDPLVISASTNLSVILGNQGRLGEAIPLLREVLPAALAIYGEGNPRTLQVMIPLAGMLLFRGETEESVRIFGEVAAAIRRLPAAEQTDLYEVLRGYSAALEQSGRAGEAEPLRREMITMAGDARPEPERATLLANLGRNLLMQHRPREAQGPIRGALEMRSRLFPAGSAKGWLVVSTGGLLADALLEQAEEVAPTDSVAAAALLAEAEPLVVKAAELLPTEPAIGNAPALQDRHREPLERAVRFYEMWERVAPDAAHAGALGGWRKKLEEYDRARDGKP